MDAKDILNNTWRYIRTLATNTFFWLGILAMGALAAAAYLTVDRALMPAYTRHQETVPMPDVRNQNVDQALQLLASLNLQPTTEKVRRLKPNVPIDAVVDQNPVPSVPVKAGRRIYLTVNSGSTPDVVVRDVTSLSHREAGNQLVNDGLQIIEKPDPFPSPDRGTVTRTDPAAGTTLKLGDTVTIYYSTGLGSEHVIVPSVVGLTLSDAEAALRELRLRAVTVAPVGTPFDALSDTVASQSNPPGTRVREGFVVRLYPLARQ
jgi:beta-lactam-binding protein with PASTA domain